jgi:hypothetical protein
MNILKSDYSMRDDYIKSLKRKIKEIKTKVAVLGLGYVGFLCPYK